MGIQEFNTLLQRCREEKPLMFGASDEAPATDESFAKVERILGFLLPREYKEYLLLHGGGYIGSINIFCTNEGSEWNLLEKRAAAGTPDNFLPISDDETGGYYGFKVNGERCEDPVYYLHPDDGGIPELKFPSFLEYVAMVALDD